MKFLSIKEAMKKGKGKVSIRGWIHRERGSSKFKFIVLRDFTNIIQCVIKADKFTTKKFKEADKLQVEASMEVTGTIKKDKRAPTGFEIEVKEFKIIGESESFPIQKNQSKEFLADNRHLWIRSRKMQAILKIRSTVFQAFREYFNKEGFLEHHSPMFQSTQCEGGSTLFKVDYFGKPLYLTQTWQLHAEATMFSLGKIYTIAPSFRAEKSKTSRHLTEYWHAEMEVPFSDFKMLQDYAEGMTKHIIKTVLKTNKEELKILERNIKKLEPTIKKKFPRITYTKALELLAKKKKMKVKWGKDLRTIEEDKLMELYDTPVIVTHYPKKVKAFYMKEDKKDKNVVLGFDMLGPEGYGELVGASQREEDIKKIISNLKLQKEDPKDYKFYLDTRRYGSIPHGGFGLGVERLVSWICGLENIKESIAFPRTMLRFSP